MAEQRRVSIEVDERLHRVDPEVNLLAALLGEGLDVPYFCWHPALGSVGACRQCAVQQFKDETDEVGRVVMACMTPCIEGGRFAIHHPEAEAMRRAVVEFLMTNHPHDCPVCEEGGHCHLQDMTVMTGHAYRRYRFTKRTHRNQDLGPFINHEMNRCIACYRCVRFYRDHAGGGDLDAFGSASGVYFGRLEDGTLESEFSGNLVEVCPTGVFTDKPYGEHYTRKWDLMTAPSICAHCSLGCNTTPGERYGRVKRIENRYHGEINGYFLCDRGRYGYGFVNREDRPRHVRRRAASGWTEEAPEAAIRRLAEALAGGRAIGIGSPRASLEANWALRTLVGGANFFRGETAAEAELSRQAVDQLRHSRARVASIRDVESADAALILGEQVLATGARLALGLRQGVRQASFRLADEVKVPRWQDASVRTLAQDLRSPLYSISSVAAGLEDVAAASRLATPGEVARLGTAVAHALDPSAPAVEGLDEDASHLVEEIAQSLANAQRPLVVSGVGCGEPAVLEAAGNVVEALANTGRTPSLVLVFTECNSVGAELLGGEPLEAALSRLATGEVDILVLLENDLTRRIEPTKVADALSAAREIVLLDAIATPMQQYATTVLPAGSFAEADGTLVNHEGRAQRYFQVFVPAEPAVRESWRWLQQIAAEMGRSELGDGLDDLTRACAASRPALAGIVAAAPEADFRVAGAKIARLPHRASGRTAMTADRDVHEPRPPADPDSPLAFTMEGAPAPVPALLPRAWAPAWNSPQAINKFQQEIGGALRGGDPGVRLLADGGGGGLGYRATAPPGDGALEVVPVHHLFGSEELSAAAPVMAERMPAPYLALHPDTAAELALAAGQLVEVRHPGGSARLPLALRGDLAARCVGLPRLPGVPPIAPGTVVTLAGEGSR